MLCPRCKKQINDKAKICPYCFMEMGTFNSKNMSKDFSEPPDNKTEEHSNVGQPSEHPQNASAIAEKKEEALKQITVIKGNFIRGILFAYSDRLEFVSKKNEIDVTQYSSIKSVKISLATIVEITMNSDITRGYGISEGDRKAEAASWAEFINQKIEEQKEKSEYSYQKSSNYKQINSYKNDDISFEYKSTDKSKGDNTKVKSTGTMCPKCGQPISPINNYCRNCNLSVNNQRSRKIVGRTFVSIIAISVALLLFVKISNKSKEVELEFHNIEIAIDSKDYSKAQEEIVVFLAEHSNSKYANDVKTMQESVKQELDSIAAIKKAEEEKVAAEKKAAEQKAEEESLAAEQKAEEEAKINELATEAGVSTKSITNMLTACENIGINTSDISFTASARDWANGKMCQFESGGYNFVIYFTKNGTVYIISSGSIRFYDKGKKLSNLSDRIVSDSEKMMLVYAAKNDIKSVLISPSTAKFAGGFFTLYEGWDLSKNFNIYKVYSYVDSQNSYGATVRSYFTIKYQSDDGKNFTPISLVFNGVKYI